MSISIGHIYWLEVVYPDTGERETRPVVVIDIKNNEITIATTITGSKIANFDGRHDKWKVPLFQWEKSQLEKGSYAKENCVADIDTQMLLPKNFIGKMHRTDLKSVISKVEDFINSDEQPW
jgi:hypothetical protein